MAQIILGPGLTAMDGSLHQATYRFLAKLAADDTAPGLHIEPIKNSADPRVRTGRVDISNRAVLFKLQGSQQEASYVFVGTFQHDEAIAYAQKTSVKINPRNGVAELIPIDDHPIPPVALPPELTPATPSSESSKETSLRQREFTVSDLTDLGMDAAFAEGALDLVGGDAVLDYAEQAPATWQASALIDIYSGESLTTVRESYKLAEPAVADADNDDDVLAAMKHPAAQLEFTFLEDDQALRDAIEHLDIVAWRIFLHPDQRVFTTKSYSGPFRLAGGAGTGKTVVLLHRARHLHRQNTNARVVLTTFNRTLADALKKQMDVLDPAYKNEPAKDLGASGIHIAGVDAIAHRVLATHSAQLADHDGKPGPVARVLGSRTSRVLGNTDPKSWTNAIDERGADLPPELRAPSFFEAEYATVVLPQLVTTREQYLKVRRVGRGVSLNRARRNAVWDVIETYRATAAADETTDFEEKAAIAAEVLRDTEPMADHVLVDEGQDLSPSRFLLLRALAAPGRDDLFIAEDSHQRIYGQPIVLGRLGINIRGRARRLTLNYRTTEENLAYALGILSGAAYSDLVDNPESTEGYRSARRGPQPERKAATSLTDQYDIAARTVQRWIDDGIAPDSIGLLVPTRKEGETLPRALGDRHVAVAFVDRDSSGPAGTPQVMTMHRSKGMEFARVILVGVGAKNMPRTYFIDGLPEGDREDARRRERSLLYVAATRARDQLIVIHAGEPSELLPKE